MAIVNGTAGNDFIHRAGDGRVPPAGFNNVTGVTTGDDFVAGLASNDFLFGDGGDDVLNGGPGADALDGGPGADYADYFFAAAGVVANLANPASNTGEAAGDTYTSIERLRGSAFNDALTGDANNNTLIGGAGADVLDGGANFDLAGYQDATAGLTANLANPASNTGEAAGDTYISIEGLIGSDFNDTLVGDANANLLRGGAGADALNGGGGFDYADYDTAVTASLANPAVNTGDAAGDTYTSIEGLLGSIFNDTLIGDNNSNELRGGTGADVLNGGGGFDYAGYQNALTALTASLANPAINNGDATGDSYISIEGLAGTPFNDILIGDDNDNVLLGGDGADTLYSGGGNDFIMDDAGPSSDLNGQDGDDKIYGGPGNDYLTGWNGDDVLVGGVDGQDSLYGGTGNDYLVAADSNNDGIGSVLDGGPGSNQLYALVGRGNDYAVGGEGADIIATGAGSDYIFGYDGNDTIVAGTGTDFIFSNGGNDFIYTDDLVTNSQDFVYVSGLAGFGTGVDTVADFTPGPGGDVAVILSTPGLTSFAQVQANMIDIGVYTVITLSATDQLYLYNVDPFQLTADNFLFL
ncbi:MAG: calcium-binding protein [Alphaproteobacteria bacterium]